MNDFYRHRNWSAIALCSIALLIAAPPYLAAQRDTALTALAVQKQSNAVALKETRALQEDVAEEAALRKGLGEKTYQALFTPPPRAQLIASLRQIGIESGLHGFGLTMEQATWLTPTGKTAISGEDLTATALHIKANAPDDRSIYSFTMRALEELPGYLKLDRIIINRIAASGTLPVMVEAELDLRWLALNDDLLFARQQP